VENPPSDAEGRIIDRALDSQEEIGLPFRCGVTRCLRKPYALMSARQRMRPVI